MHRIINSSHALQNITKVYGKGKAAVTALRDVSLEIPEKAFVGILGTSGSGKSTLLNVLGLIDATTSERYLLDGHDVSKLFPKTRRVNCARTAWATSRRISPSSAN